MKHIFLNLKRFDISPEKGGVNRLAPMKDWGAAIVSGTQDALTAYDPAEVEFVMYMPEAHLLGAAAAKTENSPVQLGCQGFPGLHGLVGGVPQGTGDPHRIVIPEVSADLPDNHGDSIGGKAYIKGRVEVVDGFDEPDTAHLEQVVRIFAPAGKPLDHRQDQPQISLDQLLPRRLIALLAALQQLRHLIAFQNRQLRRVHPGYFHFPLHGRVPPSVLTRQPAGRRTPKRRKYSISQEAVLIHFAVAAEFSAQVCTGSGKFCCQAQSNMVE